MTKDMVTVYLIVELHNGVEPRLRSGYLKKKEAYRNVQIRNNKEEGKHKYYVREFRVYKQVYKSNKRWNNGK